MQMLPQGGIVGADDVVELEILFLLFETAHSGRAPLGTRFWSPARKQKLAF